MRDHRAQQRRHGANRYRQHHQVRTARSFDRILRREVDHTAIARDFEIRERAAQPDRAFDEALLARDQRQRSSNQADTADRDLAEKRAHKTLSSASMSLRFSSGSPTLIRRWRGKP